MRKKSGISRTLKYAGLCAESVFFMLFLMVAIYSALYYYQGGFGDGNHKTIMIPFYFGFMSIMGLAVIQILNISKFIPVSISFGSLRKETFLGTQWINLILIVQCVAVFAVSLTLISSDFNKMRSLAIFVYILLLIFFSGLGQLIGAASIKFGKLGAFLIGIFVFIVVISGAVALGFAGDFIDISINQISLVIKFIAVLVALIIYCAGAYINYRMLQNYEVRA